MSEWQSWADAGVTVTRDGDEITDVHYDDFPLGMLAELDIDNERVRFLPATEV